MLTCRKPVACRLATGKRGRRGKKAAAGRFAGSFGPVKSGPALGLHPCLGTRTRGFRASPARGPRGWAPARNGTHCCGAATIPRKRRPGESGGESGSESGGERGGESGGESGRREGGCVCACRGRGRGRGAPSFYEEEKKRPTRRRRRCSASERPTSPPPPWRPTQGLRFSGTAADATAS
jgi:hypothetical protein